MEAAAVASRSGMVSAAVALILVDGRSEWRLVRACAREELVSKREAENQTKIKTSSGRS